jgi:site-specific DNA recombinase
MKRAILYIRVSTDEQADKGYSLRHQEEFLRKYCEINAIEVAELIKEDFSAKSFNRPAFQLMLSRIKTKKLKANLLLFTKWDRFSRNAPEAYAMINQLDRMGIEPQGIEQPLDFSIPENKIMLAFYLSAPEVENDRRSLNTKAGMRRALKEGRWMGKAPFGYDNYEDEKEKKYIVPNKDAEYIKFAFEQLASGLYGIEEVRRQLLEKGVQISKSRFHEITQMNVYCGLIPIPASKTEDARVVQGTHQPIISQEIFEKAQAALSKRRFKKRYTVRAHDELPLRGFINCPKCGHKLTGSRSTGGSGIPHYYYHCLKDCKYREKAEVMNKVFYNQLNRLHIKTEAKLLYEKFMKELYRNNQSEKAISQTQVQEELQKLKTRLDNAQGLLLDGQMTMIEYKEMRRTLEVKIDELLAKQASANFAENEIKAYLQDGLMAVKALGDLYWKADISGKQAILRSMLAENMVFAGGGVRTAKLNPALRLCLAIDGQHSDIQTEKGGKNCLLSCEVPRAGLEPACQ